MNIEFFKKNKPLVAISFTIILFTIFCFDRGLFFGVNLLVIFSGIIFFTLNKLGYKDKRLYLLFLIVLVLRLCSTLFMHYADFQPFSGHNGDYSTYQRSAVDISQSFRQGYFSIKKIATEHPDLYISHYYPVIIGSIYALTLPEEIIGLIVNVWLVAVTILLIYLLILEIGGSKKNAFIIGLIVTIYPGYVFNTGLLLKDGFEIFFIFLTLLFLIKIIKKLNWQNFLVFYLALICTTHFRFYIGYALIITFLVSWFISNNIELKKRLLYGVIFIIILGFVPQIAYNQGYYGINSLKYYLNFEKINFYRQTAYNPAFYQNDNSTNPNLVSTNPDLVSVNSEQEDVYPIVGLGSSFVAGHGLGYVKSFIYVLLGPLPWQINSPRQFLALFETLPWYLLLFFIIDGIIILLKKHIREALPLLIFSFIVMLLITVFDSNFGIIVRIRIPAFISLMCLTVFSFDKNNIFNNYLNKFEIWKNI